MFTLSVEDSSIFWSRQQNKTMHVSNGISDDMLAAFADGFLDEASSETVIAAIDNNPDTRERYRRLRYSKDLMKLGFGKARAPSSPGGKHGSSF